MKNVFIVIILTEDTEEYYYAFSEKPTKNQIKNQFFEDHGDNYDENDWGNITVEVFELEVL